jgi:hypothetical protein
MSDTRLGLKTPIISLVVDRARNQYYLDATDEDQGLFVDGDSPAAVAPMTRLFGPTTPGFPDPVTMMQVSYEKALMAGASYDFVRLPHLDEKLSVQGVISDVSHKETKRGIMTVIIMENVYRDVEGEVVGTEKLTFVERP